MASNASKVNRRPSFPSSSSERILANTDKPVGRTVNLWIKHGKYVALGGGGIWITGIHEAIQHIWQGPGGWIRNTLIAAMATHSLTVLIFLYLVVFLPYLRGYIPNYPKWQQSARLRVIVPLLTASFIVGWSTYVIALSQAGKRTMLTALGDTVKGIAEADAGKMSGGKGLGLWTSMAGTTALYTFTLGVLGFIQAPAGTPVKKEN